MCDLCAENGHATCPDCGCLMCFDLEDDGDDIMRRAAATEDGHIVCVFCKSERARLEERDEFDIYQ